MDENCQKSQIPVMGRRVMKKEKACTQPAARAQQV
jgi:hypothetical protein